MTKILVIEDEKILREEVIQWLALEGYETTSAEDGLAGVETALHYLPDLIICDITMPGIDGHGVLLEMLSNPATADIPFIFVSARASYEDIRHGMAMGADDYITKPFTRLELLGAVQTRLEKKTAVENKFLAEMHQLQGALEQEQERRMLNAKLVAMFSHDFRNPLTGIMSSNSLLRDYADRLDEKRRLVHFERIEAAVLQLLQMLDDMVVVAQMETGNLDFRPVSLNLTEFLQRIVEEFQIVHGDMHPIALESQFTDNVIADPRLLRQIAANLISNAIKYSPQGSQVQVLLEHQDDRIVLTVCDHGIGIPEADQHRLFTAFQRASNVGEVIGTGLGLAIVKQAVDLYGGSIYLESQLGKGTTMIVTMPFEYGV